MHLNKTTKLKQGQKNMQDNKTNDSSIFEIDENGTLIKIKKPGWNLQHLEIPEKVKYIDFYAFNNMNKLQSLTLPSTLQEIYLISLPKTIKTIINHSFVLLNWWAQYFKYNSKTLRETKTINLDEYTNSDDKPFTKIGVLTFGNFKYISSDGQTFNNVDSKLQKFNTGSFITEIEYLAFAGCKKLKYVEIGKNVEAISSEAFLDCSKLKSEKFISHSPLLFSWWTNNHKYDGKTLSEMETIDLDKYTNSDGKPFTKIGSYSFSKPLTSSNLNLQKFNTGPFITEIKWNAFADCKNLKHVEIGKNVQSIDSEIFNNCPNLKTVISHSPVLFNWWANNHKYNGKTLSEMETIDLEKYTNSDGKPFTIVSKHIFNEWSNVQNILFGNAIKQIDRQNFHGCNELKNIQITNKEILLDPNAFYHIPKTTNFYVHNEQIKEKLQRIGVDSRRIFIKPIPMEELEKNQKTKENKIELTC